MANVYLFKLVQLIRCNATQTPAPNCWLTYVIVGSVHGVLLQTVPHDVPAHEGVRRSLDVLLIVVLFRIDGGLWQATQVHVAWFVFCGLQRENGREMSRLSAKQRKGILVSPFNISSWLQKSKFSWSSVSLSSTLNHLPACSLQTTCYSVGYMPEK